MRHSRLLLAGCIGLLLARPAGAQRDTSRLAPARSMRELQARFRRAHRPTRAVIVGRWIMVKGIMLEKRSDGEPIERLFGARREDLSGHPLEWVVDVWHDPRIGYQARHQNPWTPTGDISIVRFRRTDITFEKEDGSDMPMLYRCRAVGTRRLVCLNADGPAWDGREFSKETGDAAGVPPV